MSRHAKTLFYQIRYIENLSFNRILSFLKNDNVLAIIVITQLYTHYIYLIMKKNIKNNIYIHNKK